MADIFDKSEQFKNLSPKAQRIVRRKFKALSSKAKAQIIQKLAIPTPSGAPTQVTSELPQTIPSAALEAAREPARVARQGLEQIAQFTEKARQAQPGLPLRTAAAVTARGAAVAAPGFITPETLFGGAAGRVAGTGARAVGRVLTPEATGPLTTAIKTPSVALSGSNRRAFVKLESIKRRLLKQAAPEQITRATEVVNATPRVQQKFLNTVNELTKSPTTLQQTDNATLLAAREIAGKVQGRGGTFAGLARSVRRKLSRILEKREPGFQKALERVEDVFKATGDPSKPVSLISAVMAAGRPSSAALLPGARRAIGAGIGLAGRAAGLPLQRGGTLGAITGAGVSPLIEGGQ